MERDPIPWIAGALLLAGAAYYLYRRSQRLESTEAEEDAAEEVQEAREDSNLVHFPAQY